MKVPLGRQFSTPHFGTYGTASAQNLALATVQANFVMTQHEAFAACCKACVPNAY